MVFIAFPVHGEGLMRGKTSRRRPRCFGKAGEDGIIDLDPEEAHYLLHVLRVEQGVKVEVVEGERVFLAQVELCRRRQVRLRVVAPIEPAPFDAVRIHLAPAVLHRPAMERLVRCAVELHVVEITPILSARCQSRKVSIKALSRWRKIGREACRQARRLDVPKVRSPSPLQQFLESSIGSSMHRIALTPGGTIWKKSPLFRQDNLPQMVCLLQGPEGGWTPEELEGMEKSGWQMMSLGRAVFRADTCPLVAVTLLHANFGRLLRE